MKVEFNHISYIYIYIYIFDDTYANTKLTIMISIKQDKSKNKFHKTIIKNLKGAC